MIGSHRSVQEYFRQALDDALHNQRIEAGVDVRAYLVRMLERLGTGHERRRIGEPLALLLRAAADADRERRLARYRELGDLALFVGGFFAEAFERRGISERYVRGMGRDAYLRAANLARRARGGVAPALLTELGERIGDWSSLLDEVRVGTAIGDTTDLAVLFRRWNDGRKPRHLAGLLRRGVVPLEGPSEPQ